MFYYCWGVFFLRILLGHTEKSGCFQIILPNIHQRQSFLYYNITFQLQLNLSYSVRLIPFRSIIGYQIKTKYHMGVYYVYVLIPVLYDIYIPCRRHSSYRFHSIEVTLTNITHPIASGS